MSGDTIMIPNYPGIEKPWIDRFTPSSELPFENVVSFGIELSWARLGAPPYPVAGICAEFQLVGSKASFGTQANKTDVRLLDIDNRTMKLSVEHKFVQAGDYYVRVTFGGHTHLQVAEFLQDGTQAMLKIVQR